MAYVPRSPAHPSTANHLVTPQLRNDWATGNDVDGNYSATIASPTGIASDPPLAAAGVEQAHELAAYAANLEPKIERIYSSPLYRCPETINPLAERLDLPILCDNGIGEWYSTARSCTPPVHLSQQSDTDTEKSTSLPRSPRNPSPLLPARAHGLRSHHHPEHQRRDRERDTQPHGVRVRQDHQRYRPRVEGDGYGAPRDIAGFSCGDGYCYREGADRWVPLCAMDSRIKRLTEDRRGKRRYPCWNVQHEYLPPSGDEHAPGAKRASPPVDRGPNSRRELARRQRGGRRMGPDPERRLLVPQERRRAELVVRRRSRLGFPGQRGGCGNGGRAHGGD